MLSSSLLHAGFVDAPVFAALVPTHGFWYFVREHGRDVHAGRVVPTEERLAGLFRIVAIKPVNDVGGNFLVHCFRALERERTFILARLVLGRAVGGLHPENRRAEASGNCRFSGQLRPGDSELQESESFCTAAEWPGRWGSC